MTDRLAEKVRCCIATCDAVAVDERSGHPLCRRHMDLYGGAPLDGGVRGS